MTDTSSKAQSLAELSQSIPDIQAEIQRSLDVNAQEISLLGKEAERLAKYIETKSPTHAKEISGLLDRDLATMRQRLGMSDDVVFRDFNIGGKQNLKAAIVYVDGIVDKELVHRDVLQPLMLLNHALMTFSKPIAPEEYLHLVRNHSLTLSGVRQRTSINSCIDEVLTGNTLLLVDGIPLGLSLATKGWDSRGIEEPATDSVIRGARDGFTESLRTNTMLIRRRVKDPDLRVNQMEVGRRTRTEVAVCYIESIANPYLVQEVIKRIEAIEIDAVLESGYIEQYIEDDQMSPFPQIQNTERPSKVVANLLEGRIAVIVDGTPFVLMLPATFNQFYQSPDDYNERWLIGTLIRFVRFVALIASLTFTSLYVALISFHPEMLPTRFAVAVAGGRSGIPFPSIVEALLMEVTMEILREASLRLPRQIGPTISIVGALVIGEAATRAGIVSPLMVIVVAVTTIGSFAIPSFSAAIALRILKFPVIIAAGTLGLYGIVVALIIVLIHLASLKSFGIPYLSPLAPARPQDFKDTIVRLPFNVMLKRPKFLRTRDQERLPQEIELIQGMQDKQDREES